jgi:glucose-6-phosphate 1-dehydrogenase
MSAQPASLLVIFGATGDLAQRMLLPSLYGLFRDELLPAGFRILGTARSALDDAGFRAEVEAALLQRVAAGDRDPDSLARFLAAVHYQAADVADATAAQALTDRIRALREGAVVCHLSTAPRFYAPICELLAAAGLADASSRVMLEKPIGHDLASAVAINDGVSRVFDESRVFRVDHYLGKEGVQNLLALRFGNALFEPLWNARHIEQVQITVAETIGVEGRGDYYDHSGASATCCRTTCCNCCAWRRWSRRAQFDPGAVRDEKLKVLRALRPIGAHEVATHSVAGQYAAGAPSRAWRCPATARNSAAPAAPKPIVALRAHIDNWRWSGVPFYLRTGKRMPRRCTEIYLQFRAVPHSIFKGTRRACRPECAAHQAAARGTHRADADAQDPGSGSQRPQAGAGHARSRRARRLRAAAQAVSPTSACTWTRSKAMAPCSCAATKPKPRGSGSTASLDGWRTQGVTPEGLSGRHLGPEQRGRADRAPWPQLARMRSTA